MQRAAPDPATCLRRADIAPLPVSVGAVATATALFSRAEERVAAGRFDDAEQALDCAEAVLHDSEDTTAHYERVVRC